MPDRNQLIGLIRLGREERFLEYKGSAPWCHIKTKIIRTAMAMANCRDGGTVIIGVSQMGGGFIPDGVPANHLDTYDADEIQAAGPREPNLHPNRNGDGLRLRREFHIGKKKRTLHEDQVGLRWSQDRPRKTKPTRKPER